MAMTLNSRGMPCSDAGGGPAHAGPRREGVSVLLPSLGGGRHRCLSGLKQLNTKELLRIFPFPVRMQVIDFSEKWSVFG
jgi:hypothetical protein